MLKVYCYSRCTTCKKALKWLEENGIEHEVIDIKANHPSVETLREYYALSGLPLKRFLIRAASHIGKWASRKSCRR